MGVSNQRLTILQIINEVQRKLGLTDSLQLDSSKMSKVLVDLLNDVVDEISDYTDWQEMLREATVASISSVATYEIPVSGEAKNIYEVSWNNEIAPLEVRNIEDIRRLSRISSGFGTPRQFSMVGVSGVNPIIRVWPVPTTAANFLIAYYKKPRLFTAVTADTSVIPAFPSRMLVQGLYAKALLEENGGEPTQEYTVAYAEYQRMRKEAGNRLTYDTGSEAIYLVPTGGRY